MRCVIETLIPNNISGKWQGTVYSRHGGFLCQGWWKQVYSGSKYLRPQCENTPNTASWDFSIFVRTGATGIDALKEKYIGLQGGQTFMKCKHHGVLLIKSFINSGHLCYHADCIKDVFHECPMSNCIMGIWHDQYLTIFLQNQTHSSHLYIAPAGDTVTDMESTEEMSALFNNATVENAQKTNEESYEIPDNESWYDSSIADNISGEDWALELDHIDPVATTFLQQDGSSTVFNSSSSDTSEPSLRGKAT